MSESQAPPAGLFDARYVAFLETMGQLRPRLHRCCSRMVGSVLDGEDIVQDALFQAYRKLESFDDQKPLGPWMFRIPHNQCIDFLRAAVRWLCATPWHDRALPLAPCAMLRGDHASRTSAVRVAAIPLCGAAMGVRRPAVTLCASEMQPRRADMILCAPEMGLRRAEISLHRADFGLRRAEATLPGADTAVGAPDTAVRDAPETGVRTGRHGVALDDRSAVLHDGTARTRDDTAAPRPGSAPSGDGSVLLVRLVCPAPPKTVTGPTMTECGPAKAVRGATMTWCAVALTRCAPSVTVS